MGLSPTPEDALTFTPTLRMLNTRPELFHVLQIDKRKN